MEQISQTTESTIKVAKGTTNDIIQLQFYKNPIFIAFIIYIIIILGVYYSMSRGIKRNYLFSNKFMDNENNIHWKEIFTYPNEFSSGIFTSPATIFLILGFPLIAFMIDTQQSQAKAYFYSIMLGYLILLIIFIIHLIVYHYIIDPKNVEIQVELVDYNLVKKTYASFYKTQWIILFTLLPIIVTIFIYVVRQLNTNN